jgi:hypothetical protein
MRAAARLIRCVIAPALAVLAAACARDAGQFDEPARRALALFDLARGAERDEARLADLFRTIGDEGQRAALYDALDRLPGADRPEVGRVERLDPLGRVVVEVLCRLEGSAEARYTVQLERDAEGRPRVTAFDGPGVSWPPRGRPGDSGLTSWPEP